MKKEKPAPSNCIFYSAHNSQACIPMLVEALQDALADDAHWRVVLGQVAAGRTQMHVGIFVEPYLQLVLDGKKTIESRFSVNQTAPYGRVRQGDVLLLKRSSGPIVGITQVADVWSYVLDPLQWADIQQHHARALCIDNPAFWQEKQKANYATLMRVRHVRSLEEAICFVKSDRRGWLVL